MPETIEDQLKYFEKIGGPIYEVIYDNEGNIAKVIYTKDVEFKQRNSGKSESDETESGEPDSYVELPDADEDGKTPSEKALEEALEDFSDEKSPIEKLKEQMEENSGEGDSEGGGEGGGDTPDPIGQDSEGAPIFPGDYVMIQGNFLDSISEPAFLAVVIDRETNSLWRGQGVIVCSPFKDLSEELLGGRTDDDAKGWGVQDRLTTKIKPDEPEGDSGGGSSNSGKPPKMPDPIGYDRNGMPLYKGDIVKFEDSIALITFVSYVIGKTDESDEEENEIGIAEQDGHKGTFHVKGERVWGALSQDLEFIGRNEGKEMPKNEEKEATAIPGIDLNPEEIKEFETLADSALIKALESIKAGTTTWYAPEPSDLVDEEVMQVLEIEIDGRIYRITFSMGKKTDT